MHDIWSDRCWAIVVIMALAGVDHARLLRGDVLDAVRPGETDRDHPKYDDPAR